MIYSDKCTDLDGFIVKKLFVSRQRGNWSGLQRNHPFLVFQCHCQKVSFLFPMQKWIRCSFLWVKKSLEWLKILFEIIIKNKFLILLFHILCNTYFFITKNHTYCSQQYHIIFLTEISKSSNIFFKFYWIFIFLY